MYTRHSEDELDAGFLNIFYDQFADLDLQGNTTEKKFALLS